uniref:Uncharacterized protein n=1 Tax=Ralstonia syzygii R24 TaxID=907261 RepID=G3AAL7_9RALS|nr:hypothetical protein RALSY_mp30756 [Ralstonia syzygii R24]
MRLESYRSKVVVVWGLSCPQPNAKT